MKLVGNVTALSIALGIMSAAAYAEAPRDEAPVKELTRAEAIENAIKRFDEADTNGDGILTQEEMRAGMEAMRDKMQHRPGGPEGPVDHFAQIDTDASGTVSLDEFLAMPKKMSDKRPDAKVDTDRGEKFAKAAFERLDQDDDGQLTPEEFEAGMEKMKDRRGHDGQPGPRPEAPDFK